MRGTVTLWGSVVIVSGSREYRDRVRIWRALDAIDPDLVIEGGATGADALARGWCRETGTPNLTVYPVERTVKALRGRNIAMLNMAPFATVVAFPLPDSRGTIHLVEEARLRDMNVEVIR